MASTEVLIGVVVGTIVGVILSILIIVFLLFWLGFCHCPGGDDDLRDDDDSRDENRRNNSDAAARQRQQRQYKGIPLNTVVRPLSAAEQEERDRVIARYKRRKAREERRAAREQRRQARAAARAAAAANGAAVVTGVEGEGKAMNVAGQALHRALPAGREGSNGADVTPNINTTTTIAMHGEGDNEGGGAAAGLTRRSSFASTMNTLTTTTATTALTSSAVAYGRGEYLPYDGDEYDEGEENDHNSYYNNNDSERRRRRRSTSHRGNAVGHSGRASETEMVPVSAAASSCGRHSSLSRHTLATLRGYVRELGRQRRLRRKGRRRHGAGDGDGEVDILNQWETSLGHSSSSSSSLTSSSSSSSSGGGSVGRRSVASSMPRPPEEILGRNAFTTRYSGITGMTSQPAQNHTMSPAPHTISHNSQGRSESQQQQQQYTAPTTTATGVQKADNNNGMRTIHANVATAAALHSNSTPASREPTHDSEAEELAGAVSQRELHPHTTHTSQQQKQAAAAMVGPQSQPREAEHVYYNAHKQLSLVHQPLVGRPLQSLGQSGKAQPTAVDTATTAGAAAVRQYVDAHHIDLTQSSAFGQHAMSEEERDAEGNTGGITLGQHASHPYTNTNYNTSKSKAKGNGKCDDDEGSSSDGSSSILVLGHRAPTAQGTTTTTTGGRYGDEPHTSSHAATTTTNNHNNTNNNATVDVRRRKWTGRDVEQNVALSGFFAAPMQNSLELQPRPRRSSVLHNTPDPNNTVMGIRGGADVMQTTVVGVTQRSAEEPASPAAAAVRGGTDVGVAIAAAVTGEVKKVAESK